MANELIINSSLPETRIALMEDGEIQELLIERASGKGIVGNIYKGRVTRVLPGMQAAFVDIGLEKAAFLYVDDVYVHSELWEEEEDLPRKTALVLSEVSNVETAVEGLSASTELKKEVGSNNSVESALSESPEAAADALALDDREESDWGSLSDEEIAEREEDDEESQDPVEMGPGPDDQDDDHQGGKDSQPEGTVAPSEPKEPKQVQASSDESTGNEAEAPEGESETEGSGAAGSKRRPRRGRRGGRFRRRPGATDAPVTAEQPQVEYPESYHAQVSDSGTLGSDRSSLLEEEQVRSEASSDNSVEAEQGRPQVEPTDAAAGDRRLPVIVTERPEVKSEFKAQRSRDRRIRQKTSTRPVRTPINIQDLLKEGQEVLVQVAKDPIATKGARLTCHISLPGRHLVCMPTIDHVGVSRRIEREDERRRLREYVEKNRPRNLGFIVRTASGKQQSEKRIKQDIEYLTRLWTEIREKAATVTAPSLVYEDLNAVLRAIRDWVNEEIDKVVVDSRYHFNEIQRFVSHFMPSLKQKVELYHGDIPIFDAYGISTELSRALERKVWLKSGGYIVVDQAEALVAIDVNTGRYVGKKNLEDTILKTNLEAVQEIAYQLRLRNCGGIIILDLIDMEKDENKQRVYRALEDALSRDRARPTILKISELGLVEMTRKRTRDTIIRTLCESCAHCEGKGFIKGKQTVAYEVMREIEREGIERDVGKILVQAHPDVIDILAIDERETLDQLERRYRKQIYLQAVTDFHPEQFEVTADKKERSAERGRDSSSRDHTSERSQDHHQDRHYERNRHRDRHRSDAGSPIVQLPISLPVGIIAPANLEPRVIEQPKPSLSVIIQDKQGNSELKPQPLESPNSVVLSASATQTQEGSYEEEDRLAFLRAQAAQDAALARLGSGGNSAAGHNSRNPNELSNRGPGAPGRRGGRGRRGGKFRKGADRSKERASKSFGPQSGVRSPEGPKISGGHPVDSVATPIIKEVLSTSTSGNGNGSGNGPGDHSQPPV